MKKEAFDLMRQAESSWWYAGRALAVRALLARARVSAGRVSALDYGAGHGAMYGELVRLSGKVSAFEPDEQARRNATQRGYASVYSTAAEALSHQYELIGLFDVAEHVEDDTQLLSALSGALTKNGVLVITVPAFQFLWSEHDVAHQHFRRYNKHSLSKVLADTGYEIIAISYWNTLLFLPAALVRLAGKSGSAALSVSTFIDRLFTLVVTLEAKILRVCSLPFGVSLVVIAQKKEASIQK